MAYFLSRRIHLGRIDNRSRDLGELYRFQMTIWFRNISIIETQISTKTTRVRRHWGAMQPKVAKQTMVRDTIAQLVWRAPAAQAIAGSIPGGTPVKESLKRLP